MNPKTLRPSLRVFIIVACFAVLALALAAWVGYEGLNARDAALFWLAVAFATLATFLVPSAFGTKVVLTYGTIAYYTWFRKQFEVQLSALETLSINLRWVSGAHGVRRATRVIVIRVQGSERFYEFCLDPFKSNEIRALVEELGSYTKQLQLVEDLGTPVRSLPQAPPRG
jgi:hypothetical protein